MNKRYWILIIMLVLLVVACADRSIYYSSTPEVEIWKSRTGIVLLIELILGLIFCARQGAESFGQALGTCIFSALGAYGLAYTILGEWWFQFMNWILSSMVGKIILAILAFIGGIFSLFSATVSNWVLNGFFWKSVDFFQWAVLPALVGGVIQIIIIAKAKD